MAAYQLHRMKEAQRQQYRWAPHTTGLTTVKSKDYDLAEIVEADSAYAVWEKLRENERPLQVGDILAGEDGRLQICKYIGFEEAHWFVHEAAPQSTGQIQGAPSEVR